nr:2-oxo acid dehydrogenase subunit E2 [Propionibacterium sp.]
MREFTLPSLGADMDSGKLIEWLVKPGDVVHKGQVVAVVDTSKAAIDVEIWFDGIVGALLTEPGERIDVGTVMATILAPGEEMPAGPEEPVEEPVGEPVGEPTGEPSGAGGVRLRVSPAARRRAAELGLDLTGVLGTGPGGAITLADVDAAGAARAAPEPGTAAPTASEVERLEAASPAERPALMRQAIAAAMSRSKREIPHYYLAETIPLARAVAWLTERNAARPITERVLMAVVQLKAVARALAEVPGLNGFFLDGTFRPAPVAHVGVAIALKQAGLVAPALHDVAAKDLDTLMRELTDLVARARSWTLRSSELSDATITVTNLGEEGVETVFGIITPPQVAVVGFGRLAVRPFVVDGAVAAVPTVTASLAADHRVTDGHTGALFLAALHDWLQRPDEL